MALPHRHSSSGWPCPTAIATEVHIYPPPSLSRSMPHLHCRRDAFPYAPSLHENADLCPMVIKLLEWLSTHLPPPLPEDASAPNALADWGIFPQSSLPQNAFAALQSLSDGSPSHHHHCIWMNLPHHHRYLGMSAALPSLIVMSQPLHHQCLRMHLPLSHFLPHCIAHHHTMPIASTTTDVVTSSTHWPITVDHIYFLFTVFVVSFGFWALLWKFTLLNIMNYSFRTRKGYVKFHAHTPFH